MAAREAGSIQIAYIISMYRLPAQAARLVRRLHSESTSFYVHVDRKADARIYTSVFEDIGHLRNVYFLKRHTCYWGGFGHVEATLEGVQMLISQDQAFDYAILLTGQDYPIKPMEHIRRTLADNFGKLFMEYFPLPHDDWENGGLERIQKWHFHLKDRHFTFPPNSYPVWLQRRPPRGVSLFGGSSYWCLTRASLEYIVTFLSEHPDYLRYFRHVDVPDELFFQTIIMNSHWRNATVDDNLRYIDWANEGAASPVVLTGADFPKLAESPKLFARKFDAQVDPDILDRIDCELLGLG